MLCLLASHAAAQTCVPDQQHNAQFIQGEIAGSQTFSQRVGASWYFALEPSRYGWDMRLRDAAGMDLTQITPPFHMPPNPREIYGWHFRNAVNTGDVNAPQQQRLFLFSPALTGSGGFRPPRGDAAAEFPTHGEGRGLLRILDMGLSDLAPGQKARMSYLKFDACLIWPRTAEEIKAESPEFTDAEREIIFGCGLDPKEYVLTAGLSPRLISTDIDGDDAIDSITRIIRKSDGRIGLALCRAGTWLSMIGYDQAALIPLQTKAGEPGNETYFNLAQYLARAEYWNMHQTGTGKPRLILGRTEKAELAIFWDGTKFIHELLWVFVEP